MRLGVKLADAATAGLTSAVTGGIGSIISGGLGLLGGLFKKNNNMLGIGLNMQEVKMPQFTLQTKATDPESPTNKNWQQISQDALIAYLGVRAVGDNTTTDQMLSRNFNGLFLLAYWDIYKNYYANKQEGIGYAIGGAATNIIDTYIVNLYRDNNVITKVDAITGRWDGSASLVALTTGSDYAQTARPRVLS